MAHRLPPESRVRIGFTIDNRMKLWLVFVDGICLKRDWGTYKQDIRFTNRKAAEQRAADIIRELRHADRSS